ncbi:MAG: hypothetical protein ETSY2_05580 [Candidatus Entotheonella gemina]|uniref:Lipoprotein n=1 Tax=Candidatus Entotheonella gemina TaxID=1429439 RepID=W4MFJ0_9BACT|nr:MAG: hypothetical protein ETSY2_05580 [Candidatus Entotheonella gemina]
MRRARYRRLLRGLGGLCLTLVALAGCGGSNGDASSSPVRLILRTTTVDQRLSPQVSSGTFDSLPRQIPRGDVGFVESVQITITGPDIPGSVETLPVEEDQQERFEGRFTQTVPAGDDRRIRVAAFNKNGIAIFRGETTVDLGQQVDGCEAFNSPDANSICEVTISLARLAVWGNFKWGDPTR